jgi:putative ABC transport system substrate-binding protein
LAGFRKGLEEEGFIEGRNVAIEFRWAGGYDEQLPAMAADLVNRKLAAIFVDTKSAVPVRAATTTIPIVFAVGTDPVALGLVKSINRPGGNLTGVTSVNAELAGKRLSLLRELVPQAAHYFTLVNPRSALTERFIRDLQTAAATLGIHIEVLRATTDGEIDAAFADLPQQPGTVLVFPPDSFFYIHRDRIAALAARHDLPAIFDARDYVDAGAWSATERILWMRCGSPETMPAASSRARSPPIFRFSRPPSLNWSSTSGRRKRSVSRCRRSCCPRLTT